MSTRSQIAYVHPNLDSIVSSYCHYDGYVIDGVGQQLVEKHDSFDAAVDIVDQGEMRSINDPFSSPGSKSWRRSMPTMLDRDYQTLIDHGRECGAEYIYLYEDGWFVWSYQLKTFVHVERWINGDLTEDDFATARHWEYWEESYYKAVT